MVSVVEMYALRSCDKLVLPPVVHSNISKLRMKPMVFKPFNKLQAPKPYRQNTTRTENNWREKALVEYVRRVKEREDPEYSEVFAIFNKVAMSNLEKLSKEAIQYIQKRDEQFRLRIAILLFDKAIVQHAYANVMAECARCISLEIPDIKDDIQAQISMFSSLYNMSDTLTFPQSSDPDFDNKIIECMKQKEKRRGYAKFTMELCLRGLVSEECVHDGLRDVVVELMETAKQPKTPQTDENVMQFAVFLYETAKLSATRPTLKAFMKDAIGGVIHADRASMPSLSMKARFKFDDAFKLVQ